MVMFFSETLNSKMRSFILKCIVCVTLIIQIRCNNKNDIDQFNELLNSEKYLAVLFTKECCDCVACVEAEALLAVSHVEILESFNTVIVKLSNQNKLARDYGAKDLPSFVYLRNKKPIIYDGKYEKDELLEWLGNSQEVALKTLDDESFEHLTQAATGATTGDWLVLFHDESCVTSNMALFAIMDTVALKMKGKKNLAIVDTALSPNLKDRFNINSCPILIYFRLGKMYKYELPSITISSITSFIEGFYRNSKVEPVPKIKTPFDNLVEFCAIYIKENKTTAGLIGGAFVLITILSLFLVSKSPKEKNQ